MGGKPRPAIPVGAQRHPDPPVRLVAPFSSGLDHLADIRPVIEPDELNNLRLRSAVMVDVLIAVPRRKFGGRIGELAAADLARVDAALLAVLGLTA